MHEQYVAWHVLPWSVWPSAVALVSLRQKGSEPVSVASVGVCKLTEVTHGDGKTKAVCKLCDGLQLVYAGGTTNRNSDGLQLAAQPIETVMGCS